MLDRNKDMYDTRSDVDAAGKDKCAGYHDRANAGKSETLRMWQKSVLYGSILRRVNMMNFGE